MCAGRRIDDVEQIRINLFECGRALIHRAWLSAISDNRSDSCECCKSYKILNFPCDRFHVIARPPSFERICFIVLPPPYLCTTRIVLWRIDSADKYRIKSEKMKKSKNKKQTPTSVRAHDSIFINRSQFTA